MRKHEADAVSCVLLEGLREARGEVGQGGFEQAGFEQDQVGARGVVAQADAGGRQSLGRVGGSGWIFAVKLDVAGDFANLVRGDGAGAVDDHGGLAGVEDSGFHAVVGGAGVEDGVDATVEIGEDVCGCGRADVAEEVGAGGGDGNAGLLDEREGDGMGGHADADEGTAGGDGIGHGGGAREEKSQGTGPEGAHEALGGVGDVADEAKQGGIGRDGAGDVHDDGVPGGAVLGEEDALDGGRVEGVGAEAVDGLGGQGDETAIAEQVGGGGKRGLALSRGEIGGVDKKAEGLGHSILAGGVVLPERDEATWGRRIYSQIMVAVETEIKFRVADVAELQARLQRVGFHLETPRTFESNVLYDTPERSMRARTEILRIRNYGERCTLTHKRLPEQGPGEDRHKHRIETETQVSDGKALAEVFSSLGLTPSFRYEKWRSEWSDGEGHCVVDETPIGSFAELEGTPEWIDRVAAELGVAPGEYMTLSYGRLFEVWKEEHRSAAEHLTFADLQGAESRR